MKKQHPQPAMALPISVELHQQLQYAVCSGGFEQEDWEIGAAAIRAWMVKNAPDAFPMPVTNGFQWKQLFLPSGTLLRTVFDGKNYHCRVEGDHLIHDGEATSPSRFVNGIGGVRRNAWQVVWLLFPDCPTWQRAAALRAKTTASLQRRKFRQSKRSI